MIVPLVLLVCDRCEEVISDGFTATEAREDGAKKGYRRIKRTDLCEKCLKAPKMQRTN